MLLKDFEEKDKKKHQIGFEPFASQKNQAIKSLQAELKKTL